jgi:hypothetical protein
MMKGLNYYYSCAGSVQDQLIGAMLDAYPGSQMNNNVILIHIGQLAHNNKFIPFGGS